MTMRTRALALVLALTAASPADAHLMNTGFGPFYDGLTHLVLTPEDLLPALGIALLAGLHGPRCGRAVLFALPAAWLVGSIVGLLVAPQVTLPAATAAVTIVIGALVAADRPLAPAAVAGVAVVLGLLNGSLDGIELTQARSGALRAAGVAGTLFVLMALVAGQVASLRAAWARVAVRVVGSWIGAIGLFMLGWSVRGG